MLKEKAVETMRGAYLNYLAGVLVVVVGLLAMPTLGMAAYGDYVSTITAGGLNQPAKVAVDASTGDIYVTDSGSKMVKKYDCTGSYVSGFTLSVAGTPVGIDTNGTNIFVGDDTNNCVWVYDMNGTLVDLGGTGVSHKLGGASMPAITMPNTVRVSPSGHIFVVDGDNDKVYIFGANGAFASNFGVSGSTSSGQTIQCYFPSGLAFANSTEAAGVVTQYFYLGDQGNTKVQKLYYRYNSSTLAITTAPTYVNKIGVQGDNFSQFLRVTDIAWDKNYDRLAVVDSLQMVVQLFDVNGATLNQAFNYSAGVQGYLNVPTGVAFGAAGKAAVASNQGDSIALFNVTEGTAPAISALSPATNVTPTTTPYSVNYTVDDSDSTTVTMSFFYYNTSTPSTLVSIGSQTVTLAGGTYSGSINWNWALDPGPTAGNYKVLAKAIDDKNNYVEQSSAGDLLVVTPYDSCTGYTNAHYALYGPSASDYDSDTLGNCGELGGTYNTAYGNAPTDMNSNDSDSDGLDDGVECGAKNLSTNLVVPMAGAFTISTNPNNVDTDSGGASDAVELVKGTSATAGGDDLAVASSPQDLVLSYFKDGVDNARAMMAFNNVGTSTLVFDLVYFNKNGGVNKTVPAAYVLTPMNVVHFDPSVVHGVSEGSIEVRSTSANIAADVLRSRVNYANTVNLDAAESTKFIKPSEGATFLVSDTWSDSDSAARRFKDYIYIKNWADTSASITVDFRRNTDGTSSAHPFTLGAHEVLEIMPRDYAPSVWAGGAIEITSNVPVTGYHNRDRFNVTDSNTYDIATMFDFVAPTDSTTYSPVWSDSSDPTRRFIGYCYVYNPNSTAINYTVTFWDNSGNVVGTKSGSIGAHIKAVIRPTTDLTPPPPSSTPGGTFKIVTTGGNHTGGTFIQRYSAADVNLIEWSYYMQTFPLASAVNTQYVAHYRDNAQSIPTPDTDRWISFNYIFNPSSTNTANVAVDFYNPDGSYAKTSNFTVNPLNKTTFSPFRQQAGPKDGSFKITSTQPFLGFSMGQFFNFTDVNKMDVGFRKANVW